MMAFVDAHRVDEGHHDQAVDCGLGPCCETQQAQEWPTEAAPAKLASSLAYLSNVILRAQNVPPTGAPAPSTSAA
jgi:hypothetical protein